MKLLNEEEVYKMLDNLTDLELDPERSAGWNDAVTEACRRVKDIPAANRPDTIRSWKRRIVNIALMTVFVAVALSMLIIGLFEGSLFMILLAAGGLVWAIYEVINGGLE